jgi:hypothetical protein
MSTPGAALVGYAILRANYNSQAPNYLDNFAPFVLSAISSSPNAVVERHTIARSIRDTFGLNIPALVIPRLIRHTNREGLTEPVGVDAVRLTSAGEANLPDLTAALAEYRRKQTELVHEFASFIEQRFPEHADLTTGDLGASLAEFFDGQAISVLRESLGRHSAASYAASGIQYVVAAFVTHLAGHDQSRFSYVVEAAKGAMLASVLELDTSGMHNSLATLTIVLDTPVVMDALGYHGEIPQSAIVHVLELARAQGVRIVMFDHSISEMDGILEAIEGHLRRGTASRSTATGYLHFAESGATPADLALLRARLTKDVAHAGIDVIERPDGYHKYGLDEGKLEERIQGRVHYLQDAARANDVRSLSAVHRLRRGERAQTLEECRAVMMTSNFNLVRGAQDFRDERSFPLAATTESAASLLWVRSPAIAPDVPRQIVLATAYVGMQPSPTLWSKYLAEVESLEKNGQVSADDAVVLRSTRVGRDALMEESLGETDAVVDTLPIAVLERVRGAISDPFREEVGTLESQLARTEAEATHATAEMERQVDARVRAEAGAAARTAESEALRERVARVESAETQRVSRIHDRARQIAHRWVRGAAWTARGIALLVAVLAIIVVLTSDDLSRGWPAIVIALIGIASFVTPFFPRVDGFLSKLEDFLTKRGAQRLLRNAGYDLPRSADA